MAQLKDLIVNGDAALNGNVVLNHDPTSVMQAATKQYVDNKVSGGEYVLEVPAGLYYGMSNISGTVADYNAAFTAMQAGKKVYAKIAAEQLEGTARTSNNWIYIPLTFYKDITLMQYLGFSTISAIPSGESIVTLMFSSAVNSQTQVQTVYWGMAMTSLVPASGVSF